MSIKDAWDSEKYLVGLQEEGLGHEICIREYSKSTTPGYYKTVCENLEYSGPRYCADMLAALVIDKKTARVLDIAAGTGLVGQQLHQRGFYNIDAHDGSAAMLKSCKELGVYTNFINCFVGEGHSLTISDNTYDALVCSGATIENHLPPSAQSEFIRVIKPGGFFVNAYRSSILEINYGKRWEAEAKRLEQENKWTFYGRLVIRKFNRFTKGFVDIFEVL